MSCGGGRITSTRECLNGNVGDDGCDDGLERKHEVQNFILTLRKKNATQLIKFFLSELTNFIFIL